MKIFLDLTMALTYEAVTNSSSQDILVEQFIEMHINYLKEYNLCCS